MAPIVYHQVAADIAIDDHTAIGGSATVMMAETEEHQAGDQFAVDSNNFDDVGHTRDENDVGGVLSMGGAVAVIPRSGEATSNDEWNNRHASRKKGDNIISSTEFNAMSLSL